MKFHPLAAFAALVLGSGLASLHGCSVSPVSFRDAKADATGAGGAGGAGGGQCKEVVCAAPSPTTLGAYADVLAALSSGSRVRVVLDYSKCKIGNGAAPNALGAMNMDTFEWFAKDVIGNPKPFLAASESHLIRLQSGFVYDYVRVRLADDESVTVDVQYLDPKTFAVTVDETITCGLTQGSSAKGATFYKLP